MLEEEENYKARFVIYIPIVDATGIPGADREKAVSSYNPCPAKYCPAFASSFDATSVFKFASKGYGKGFGRAILNTYAFLAAKPVHTYAFL